MKTFAKLFAVLAVLAIGFTSCGDDNEGDVTIKLDHATVDLGGAVTGTITSTNSLATVTLITDGKTVTGWPITSFKTGAVIEGDGVYTIRIEGLDAGSYTIRATDKDGVEDSKNFTIKGDVVPEITYTATSITVVEGKTYGYKQGTTTGTFTVTAVSAGSVTITIGGTTVTLSDAGNSYLSKTFAGMNLAAATANPENVLFCLLAGSTNVASGTEATNATIKAGATETLFTASPIE